MGPDVADGGQGPDGVLDALSDFVSGGQGAVGGQFEVQGDAALIAVVKDGDVVGFADGRFAEGNGENPVAKGETATAGFDVYDDVAVGQHPLDCVFDLVSDGVGFDHGLARWDGDDDVGE